MYADLTTILEVLSNRISAQEKKIQNNIGRNKVNEDNNGKLTNHPKP